MTDQNRTPSGVPTGGQFAASARAEADVRLGTDAQTDSQTDAAAARVALRQRIDSMKAAAERLNDLDTLLLVRDQARAAFGDEAAYLRVIVDDGSGDGSGAASMHFVAYDANQDEIDDAFAEGYEPFAQPLPKTVYANGLPDADLIDLDALDDVDLESEVNAAESAISSSHIGRTALDSFVVDRDYAVEIAQDHIEQGWDLDGQEIDDLTDEERRKVGEWFETTWGGFGDGLYRDWHEDVDQALTDVLSETRGA